MKLAVSQHFPIQRGAIETSIAPRWRLFAFLVLSFAVHVVALTALQGTRISSHAPYVTPLEVTVTEPKVLHSEPAHDSGKATSLAARATQPPRAKRANIAQIQDEPTQIDVPDSTQVPTIRSSLPQQPWAQEPAAFAAFDSAQYLPVTALDRYPRLRQPLPEIALPESVSNVGRVRLSMWIDELGAVSKAEVIEASAEEAFDRSLLDAYRQATFIPGERDGVPVKSQLIIEIDW